MSSWRSRCPTRSASICDRFQFVALAAKFGQQAIERSGYQGKIVVAGFRVHLAAVCIGEGHVLSKAVKWSVLPLVEEIHCRQGAQEKGQQGKEETKAEGGERLVQVSAGAANAHDQIVGGQVLENIDPVFNGSVREEQGPGQGAVLLPAKGCGQEGQRVLPLRGRGLRNRGIGSEQAGLVKKKGPEATGKLQAADRCGERCQRGPSGAGRWRCK